jgi:hypothetical protein
MFAFMKTTLEIPDDLYRQAKVQAAQENRKMKDLVSEGLRLVLGLSKKLPMRRSTSAVRKKDGIPSLSKEQLAEIVDLAGVWGVTPGVALKRITETARAANASRKKALAALEKVRRHPPYAAGKVQAMIDEANRLRKESWE